MIGAKEKVTQSEKVCREEVRVDCDFTTGDSCFFFAASLTVTVS